MVVILFRGVKTGRGIEVFLLILVCRRAYVPGGGSGKNLRGS
jgi:hypothetical protein